MKTALKVLGVLAALAASVVGGLIGWLSVRKPAQRAPSAEHVQATPALIERGRYLADHVTMCLDCHSERLLAPFAMPIKPGTEGQGGFIFDKGVGVPGLIAARNLTPDPTTGKAAWSDGELIRAIREGVDRDGEALFPMMPYKYFRNLADEDVRAVVAFLRTLKPIKNPIPQRRLDFPVNLFVKFDPQPLPGPVSAPDDAKDHLAYGKYMTTISACMECHTAHDDKGQLVPGGEFAGGWEFKGPWGVVVSANLTPHKDAYLGTATKADFIGRFKMYANVDPLKAPLAQKGRNTVMPWYGYAGMSERDLGAIYDYLKSLPAKEKKVNPFPEG
jgi:mono/diheme cytochrome c family protein